MLTIESLMYELQSIFKKNAPVRDAVKYPGKRGNSPYPGNLKQNGIYVLNNGVNDAVLIVGNEPAPYAVYTETKSRKKNWQENSFKEFLQVLRNLGGQIYYE